MRLLRVRALIERSPWAISEVYARVVADVFQRRVIEGGRLSADDLAKIVEQRNAIDAQRGTAASGGLVAVVPIHGVLVPHAGAMEQQSGATSPESIAQAVSHAAADPTVKTILLDCDSPGGNVQGIPECAAAIREARKSKQVVAQANYQCSSACYWLAAQADEIVVSPSAEIGSIGVLAMHEDVSKAAEMQGVKVSFVTAGANKAEGNSFEPLSDPARAETQSKVNAVYGDFTADIAKGRGVSASTVRGASWGQGRTLLAEDAVKVGMADRVATFGETLARFMGGGRVSRGTSAADGQPVPTVEISTLEYIAHSSALRDIDDTEAREREMAWL